MTEIEHTSDSELEDPNRITGESSADQRVSFEWSVYLCLRACVHPCLSGSAESARTKETENFASRFTTTVFHSAAKFQNVTSLMYLSTVIT